MRLVCCAPRLAGSQADEVFILADPDVCVGVINVQATHVVAAILPGRPLNMSPVITYVSTITPKTVSLVHPEPSAWVHHINVKGDSSPSAQDVVR
jgi:hypothetical protein